MIVYAIMGFVVIVALLGLRIVPQTHRGLIERFGRYNRYARVGLNWVIPVVESVRLVNVTEAMVNATPQQIITKDKLNAQVDAQIYFKVRDDEFAVMASQYNVNNYLNQIVALARTTLRNIIGTLNLTEANSERDRINTELSDALNKEAKNWGIEVVRAELKEIDPPSDVQETMNRVVKAENEKTSAVDFATATETRADGERRAKIKEAEGYRQGLILKAQGEAEAIIQVADAKAQEIKLINESANKYFEGNAQLLKRLQVTENALKDNTKYFIDAKASLVNVVGNASGDVLPLPSPK